MKNLITIVCQDPTAEKLKGLGFQYISHEKYGKRILYVYEESADLIDLLQKQFADTEFFMRKKLFF